jgi:cytochrome c-type biogenesis protein CcmE
MVDGCGLARKLAERRERPDLYQDGSRSVSAGALPALRGGDMGVQESCEAKEMKVQITLEDKGSGVQVKFDPPLADMVRRATLANKGGLSPAQNYAVVMADAVRQFSKHLDEYDPNKDLGGL